MKNREDWTKWAEKRLAKTSAKRAFELDMETERLRQMANADIKNRVDGYPPLMCHACGKPLEDK